MTESLVITVAPSPAFYVALVLYAAAALLYVSAFVEAPAWMAPTARWLLPALYIHRIATGGSRWVRH